MANKVLILTASYGEGHNAAARNLRDALELRCPDAEVEIVDALQRSYPRWNDLARKTHLGLVRYAPVIWRGFYGLLDRSRWLRSNHTRLRRLQAILRTVLAELEPACVVSTFPLYAHALANLYPQPNTRPFRLITVVTDSISVNSAWVGAPNDWWIVPNAATAQVLITTGVPGDRIQPLGFPVSHRFAEPVDNAITPPEPGLPRRILYLINSGKRKSGKVLERLLRISDVHLTVVVGRDPRLRSKLARRLAGHGDRLRLIGWTNDMPWLLRQSHLLIGKAGGAIVQEAIAACCPVIINQVIPGQEEGNAELVRQLGIGAIATKRRALIATVNEAFAHWGRLWRQWRERLAEVSQPDAALRLADLVLRECEKPRFSDRRNGHLRVMPSVAAARQRSRRPALLCDFHTHTNYSDGKLSLPELVDFYGRRGFDCVCVTDHLADPRGLIGRVQQLSRLTLSPGQLDEYFEVLQRERRRAWRHYRMILMTGIEFNKDGYTRKTSAHLLGIDLQSPVDPGLDLPETIDAIHAQGGLAVASHPHIMRSVWGHNTLYLWENCDRFAPLLDAWEIANRNNLFAPISQRRLPFIANSDFHKPKHIHSWKTLLHCDKDPQAIKDCVRDNEHVSITLYRDDMPEPIGAATIPDLPTRTVVPEPAPVFFPALDRFARR
jgi:UDP-N-acetylglucosamine:LPS N-acetylglucosamine transferase